MTTSVFAPPTDCSSLVPEAWDEPVDDAAAPVEGETDLATLKSWIGFAVQQTANKRKEFDRAKASRDIIRRCEERDRAAVKRAEPKFLGIF